MGKAFALQLSTGTEGSSGKLSAQSAFCLHHTVWGVEWTLSSLAFLKVLVGCGHGWDLPKNTGRQQGEN